MCLRISAPLTFEKRRGLWLDAEQPPSMEEVTKLGAAMAQAVHALHQQNAVHLDLKPANI